MHRLPYSLVPAILLTLATSLGTAAAPANLGPWTIDGYASDLALEGDGRLEVRFHSDVDWPHAILRDLSGAAAGQNPTTLVVPVENPGDAGIDLFIRVGDDREASWPDHAIAVRQFIGPHRKATLLIALAAHDPTQMGMQDPPPPIGAAVPATLALAKPTGHVDATRITSVYLVVWGRTGPRSLILGAPRVESYDWGRASYAALVDRYGQFARASWPQKITGEQQFSTLATSEELAQKGDKPPRALDRYGGVLAGPALGASGFFRVARTEEGRWWLVTPEGHAFFSVGVNTVTLDDPRTFVSGREFMFEELPNGPGLPEGVTADAPAAPVGVPRRMQRFNSGRWVNFYALNLARKFGPKFAASWPRRTLQRLSYWSFNTIGNWSAAELWDTRTMAYTVPVSLPIEAASVPGNGADIAPLPDPFDAAFARSVATELSRITTTRRDDPWLLGYFVDNELSWGDGASADAHQRVALALRVLALGANSAAKQALVAQLRARYRDIGELSQAWGVTLASWQALSEGPVALPSVLTRRGEEDLALYCGHFAETYYRIVAQTLHRMDPNHLYLGSRFAAQTDEALNACAKWCDVISFNIYSDDLAPALKARLGSVDKPVLIGEFNFSSSAAGVFGRGLVDVGAPEERARAYAAYVEVAAASPNVVGAHWFQFLDEPASGRLLDGENSPFGLVSVTDSPYFDFLAGVRAANRQIWGWHSQSRR